MKKISKILYVVLITLIMFSVPNITLASEIGIGNYDATDGPYSFSNDEKQIYLPFARFSNGNITVDKPVNNMGVMFSNSRIEINEDVNKMSAIFANDSIRVNANLTNSVLFASSSIIIDSEIDGDVILFGGSEVTISEEAVVNGDIIVFTESLNIKGKVKGSVIGATTTANITGIIEKDLRIEASKINVEDENSILGEFYIESYEELDNIKQLYPNVINKIIETTENKIDMKQKIGKFVYEALVLTILYFILALLHKKQFFNNQLEKIKKYKTPIILVGTLGFVAIPIVVLIILLLIILGLSIIAIPVTFIYLTLLIVSGTLGVFTAGSTIVTIIRQKYLKEKNIIYSMLVAFGIFIALYLTTMLPVLEIVYIMYALGVLTILLVKKNDVKK